MPADRSQRISALHGAARERILMLDGAMGTMIQRHHLQEADFRGERFADWPQPLGGNNDLLVLTQPDIIRAIHWAYLDAGADIIETNTFNSTEPSQADYGAQALVPELNLAAARIAREAADAMTALTPDRPRWVAGVLGPTSRTASISPDVNDPAARNTNFDDLAEAYREATRALIAGGVDIIMIETIFDTLNAKAAIFAVGDVYRELDVELPLMISGTITDASGRTLSGQTIEAFLISMAHVPLFSMGLNCALGAAQMRPYLEVIAEQATCRTSVYPNAGLPDQMGEYRESPEVTAKLVGEFMANGWVNVVGGCCGTTPPHIAALAAEAKKHKPRPMPVPA